MNYLIVVTRLCDTYYVCLNMSTAQ